MGVRGGLSEEVTTESGKQPCKEVGKRVLGKRRANTEDLMQEQPGTARTSKKDSVARTK